MRPIINLPEEDRATDIGNTHIRKDRACDSGNIIADTQTHRHTHRQTLQYFATAPATEVKNCLTVIIYNWPRFHTMYSPQKVISFKLNSWLIFQSLGVRPFGGKLICYNYAE